MFLTNHTLTGLVLSRVVDNPLLLAPAAFASHLAMDSLWHYGDSEDKLGFGSPKWIKMATIDNLIALTIFGGVFIAQPEKRAQTVVGVFFACLPDLLFIIEILRKKRFTNPFSRFHSKIQWGQRPSGIILELIWAVVMATILSRLLQ